MSKITLHLKQVLPFANNVPMVELEPARILCNDITLPFESHPHNMRLWVIGNEYGAIGAVWASHEQDALDELVDAGLGDGLLVSAEDEAGMSEAEREDLAHLGNAGESADLEHCWLAPVAWDLARDCALIALFAEARGVDACNLDDNGISTRYVK